MARFAYLQSKLLTELSEFSAMYSIHCGIQTTDTS